MQGMEKGLTLAINESAIVNQPSTFQTMEKVAPKVCTITANDPEFVGFHALIQVGAHPVGGRFGGAQVVTADSLEAVMESPTNIQLNPLNLWQYTLWEKPESHERMHEENFDLIFEHCHECLDMVMDGPWEPVYEIAEVDMPELVGMTGVPQSMGNAFANQEQVPKARLPMKRLIAVGEHYVMPGREEAFLEGLVKTLETMKEQAAGLIGWMILRKTGETAISTLQLAPGEFWQAVETSGANPPASHATNYGVPGKDFQGPALPSGDTPSEYLVHMEWESPESLNFGLAATAVNPKLRKIHDEGVMRHLWRVPPYYRVFAPMMEDMVFFH
ncbi:MAG TPA: sulfur oxygenase reductase family protein [Gammaproteobacteria bacterium]|nr:sulfur oxygenase reductase family protein [Gammaproteobacteria bacterium]